MTHNNIHYKPFDLVLIHCFLILFLVFLKIHIFCIHIVFIQGACYTTLFFLNQDLLNQTQALKFKRSIIFLIFFPSFFNISISLSFFFLMHLFQFHLNHFIVSLLLPFLLSFLFHQDFSFHLLSLN